MADRVAVTLIRHGKTLANLEKRYQGWSDEPLLCREKERLHHLQSCYAVPDLLIASDLRRCMVTAAILFPEQEVISDAGLRELNFGDFEGKNYDELKACKEYKDWLHNLHEKQPPNGEAFAHFTKRLQASWQTMVSRLGDAMTDIAIVTHSGVIRYFLETYSPNGKPFWEWRVPFGAGFRLIAEREQLRRGERCISLQEVPLMEKPNG